LAVSAVRLNKTELELSMMVVDGGVEIIQRMQLIVEGKPGFVQVPDALAKFMVSAPLLLLKLVTVPVIVLLVVPVS